MEVIEENIKTDDLVLSHLYNISDVKLMQDLMRHNPTFKDYLNLNNFSTWDWINLFENLDDEDNKVMEDMLDAVDLLCLNGKQLSKLLSNCPNFFDKFVELDLWWKFDYFSFWKMLNNLEATKYYPKIMKLKDKWDDYAEILPSINGNKFIEDDIDYDNYYKSTRAVFEVCEKPTSEPDYISTYKDYKYNEIMDAMEEFDAISSRYWYGEDEKGKYIIRESDHWDYVGSCLWVLTEGGEYILRQEWLGEIKYGKTYFKNNKK